MVELDIGGVRNLLGAIRGEKFRAPTKPYAEWRKGRSDSLFVEPVARVILTSDAPIAPLGDYYICQRRAKGYPSYCKACQARCSRAAFEDRRDIVVANLEKYCQARKAPSAWHRAAQMVGCQRYCARKRGAKGRLTTKEWRAIQESYGGRCAYCGDPGSTQDHVVPISRGGTHTADNVVPACGSCNSQKRNKMILKKGQFTLSF
jgi:5-methylcytosine-specific restriction endonuclease McrA